MQSDGPEPVDLVVSGERQSRETVPPPPQNVVLVHQEPRAVLTLWPSGLAADAQPEEVSLVLHPRPELRPSRLAGGVGEHAAVRTWLARLGFLGGEARRGADAVGRGDVTLKRDELPPPPLPRLDNGPVIRSKVQFSKAADGTQTLSYEEETVKPEDEGAAPACGRKMHPEGRRRRLRSTFLDILRFAPPFF